MKGAVKGLDMGNLRNLISNVLASYENKDEASSSNPIDRSSCHVSTGVFCLLLQYTNKRESQIRTGSKHPAHCSHNCGWSWRGLGAFFIYKAEQKARQLENIPEHYRRLIEESFSQWLYKPASSGKSIIIPHGPETVPYFTRCLEHLASYEELWQLYQNGPILAKEAEQEKTREMSLRHEIKAELIDTVERNGLMRGSIHENVLEHLAKFIADDLMEESLGRSRKAIVAERASADEGRIRSYVLGSFEDVEHLAYLMTILKDYKREEMIAAYKAEQDANANLRSNILSFERLLKEQIVETCRSTNYTSLKGRCKDCSSISQG